MRNREHYAGYGLLVGTMVGVILFTITGSALWLAIAPGVAVLVFAAYGKFGKR